MGIGERRYWKKISRCGAVARKKTEHLLLSIMIYEDNDLCHFNLG